MSLLLPIGPAQAEPLKATDKFSCQQNFKGQGVEVNLDRTYAFSAGKPVFAKEEKLHLYITAASATGPLAKHIDLAHTHVWLAIGDSMQALSFRVAIDDKHRLHSDQLSIAIVDRTGRELWSSPQGDNDVVFPIDGQRFMTADQPIIQYKMAGNVLATFSFPTSYATLIERQVAQQRAYLDSIKVAPGDEPPEACKKEDCFFTTAAVTTVGLADDCWELRTLRALRDAMLARGGWECALVDDYYATAPAIVAAIEELPSRRQVWLRTYWTGVVPAALLHRIGLEGAAIRVYRRLFAGLLRQATFLPAG